MAQGRSMTSSGLKTSSAIIATGRYRLGGVLIVTDGTNAATVIIYDALSATSTILFKGTVPGSANFGGSSWEIPIRAKTGIYAEISGTGAACVVYFDKE